MEEDGFRELIARLQEIEDGRDSVRADTGTDAQGDDELVLLIAPLANLHVLEEALVEVPRLANMIPVAM